MSLREGDIGPFGYKMLGSVGIYETLQNAERTDLWKNRMKHKSKASAPWCKRGIAVTTAIKGFGFGALPDFAAASIKITPTGKFVVGVSCPEIGQGQSRLIRRLLLRHCTATSPTFTSPPPTRKLITRYWNLICVDGFSQRWKRNLGCRA